MALRHLSPSCWNERSGLKELMHALAGDQGDTRFVGGFVRDNLLEIGSADIDCATKLRPESVLGKVEDAGFKAVPTGLAHGTITAVLPSGPVEITTLRRDISTDGRRATVSYTDDWQEDAARRDFTINALFADTAGGIYDYFGGIDDLAAGRVRFIGDPLTRIAEDHLRILRFFRFHARFGKGAPDEQALAACASRARDLMALSRERIADELLKLLALPDPSPTIRIMTTHGILRPILPEIDDEAPERVARLVAAEHAAGVQPDAVRRLASLLPQDGTVAEALGIRLKLSRAARKRLLLAAGNAANRTPFALAYDLGRDSAIDRLLLAGRPGDAADIIHWDIPRLPVSGGALVKRGLNGPIVAATLREIETRWVAENFPDDGRVAQITDEAIRRLSKA